jgi:sortase A
MTPLPHRHRHLVLRITSWLFVVLGIASLAFVAYSLVDANLFQAYENWRLNHALRTSVVEAKLLTVSSTVSVHPPPATPPGTTLGRIEISRIGVAVIMVEGTDEATLRRAVGHITGTAMPGQPGNVGIAGHRDGFFRPLRNIRLGDEITLTTLHGSFHYRVESVKIVTPQDSEVLIDSGGSFLTLVTCYPFYFVGSAPSRFIVRAHKT